MNSALRNLLVMLALVILVIMGYSAIMGMTASVKELQFTEFEAQVDKGNVKKIIIKGARGTGDFLKPVDNKPSFVVILPEDRINYTDKLVAKGISVSVEEAGKGQGFMLTLLLLAPAVLMGAFMIMFMRQMQAGGNKAMSFGKSRARLMANPKDRVTFKDVAGMEEVKEEVQEIIEFLKEPQKFQKLGGTIPRGVLLMGSPGTGKTLLARAIAGEANVPFFSISGSEFVELFVGVGASRVRDTFEQAKKNSPCLVFIDEIDAVGRSRGVAVTGGHEEREQTLNQLLVEMDGFDPNEGVIILAATNRPDVLDPALLRPGRFDRRIHIPRPDLKGREAILKVHARKVPLEDTVDLHVISRGTPGFSGADLKNLVNEAALRAARFNKVAVDMEDFEFAKDKVIMGLERRSLVVSAEERRQVAFHEAGHTVAGWYQPEADPVHKVTIIPRGAALGVTQSLPVEDSLSHTREFLEAQLAVLMGGRVAEERFLHTVTTGAGNDLERATMLARHMVTRWGMSEKLGPVSFPEHAMDPFSMEPQPGTPYSIKVGDLIDEEVRGLLDRAHNRTAALLTEHDGQVRKLAEELLDKETLDREDLLRILGPRPAGAREVEVPPAPPKASTGNAASGPEGGEEPAGGLLSPVPGT